MTDGFSKALTAARKLPGIQETVSYGTPALKVAGKFLARLREPGILVLRCPVEEKEMLMAAAPEIYFETDHYKGWDAILIRLAEIGAGELANRFEIAWRMQAPKKLQKNSETPAEPKAKPKVKAKSKVKPKPKTRPRIDAKAKAR